MSTSQAKTPVPVWIIAVVVLLIVAACGAIVFRTASGPRTPRMEPVKVKPGMIDFQAELRKGNVGRRN